MTSEAILERAREVFDVEIKGLKAVRASLSSSTGARTPSSPDNAEAFVSAVRAILKVTQNGGIVVVTGVGKNLHVAEKISAIMSSTGTRSIVLNPVQAMHGDLGMVSARDVLLALSFSGESDEIVRLIPAIRRHGLKVISMTRDARSTLAEHSDIHIAIPCGREACPFGMAPTNSTTATMAMGDALAIALIDARKFSIEQYAGNHPAGAIGKALLLKVADVMRSGGDLALVPPTATVMDAVMAMTAAKGGSAVLVDKAGRLKGIFTDGDFRRIMSKSSPSSVLGSPVSAYATAKPSFVHADQYASDLMKIFEKKRIDDLPVVDRLGRVVGLVDIQDLPKMKVL